MKVSFLMKEWMRMGDRFKKCGRVVFDQYKIYSQLSIHPPLFTIQKVTENKFTMAKNPQQKKTTLLCTSAALLDANHVCYVWINYHLNSLINMQYTGLQFLWMAERYLEHEHVFVHSLTKCIWRFPLKCQVFPKHCFGVMR